MLTLGDLAPAVLRLVLEAGQGVTALVVDKAFLAPATLQQRVAPLLQEHAGRVTTLCTGMGDADEDDVSEEWWRALLGRLPTSITHFKVNVLHPTDADPYFPGAAKQVAARLRALVEGGVAALRRPFTLTLVHEGQISAEMEAELVVLSLVAPAGQGNGGADGEGQQQQPLQSFFTLRVVRIDQEEA